MTVKNRFLEQSDNPQRRRSLTLSFRLCLSPMVVCMLIPLGCAETLSQNVNATIAKYPTTPFPIWKAPVQVATASGQRQTQANSTVAANFAAKVEEKPPDLLIVESPTTDLSRQLQQARISPSADDEPDQSKDELRQMIRQISLIEFKPPDQASESSVVVEPAQEAEPNEMPSDTDILQETDPNRIERKLPDGRVTDQTLQIFRSLSQHPDRLHNPFVLAEILFNSHCLTEAAACYRQALDRVPADEADPFANKAWILFQIGNCLRNTDRPAATQMYRQLIAEYPDSPWADLAKAESKLIDWYLRDKPDTLINERSL